MLREVKQATQLAPQLAKARANYEALCDAHSQLQADRADALQQLDSSRVLVASAV